MMKYRHARNSTDAQPMALHCAALKRARCSHIFEDKGITGATAKRPSLLRCPRTLRAGDTLIVWKLNRLGRSLRDLIATIDDLRARRVAFQSITDGHRHPDALEPGGVADDWGAGQA